MSRTFTPLERSKGVRTALCKTRKNYLSGKCRKSGIKKTRLHQRLMTQAVYPRAHTCFNRIDVPLYRTQEELVASFEFVLELGDQTFTMD